jgi:hypothetical protein
MVIGEVLIRKRVKWRENELLLLNEVFTTDIYTRS